MDRNDSEIIFSGASRRSVVAGDRGIFGKQTSNAIDQGLVTRNWVNGPLPRCPVFENGFGQSSKLAVKAFRPMKIHAFPKVFPKVF